MGTNDQPFPDVAFIALKDMEDTETNIYYPDDYRNRYAISQVVDEKNHKNIKKNLEFFKELEKKANDLKVIKLQLLCHGSYTQIPGSKERLLLVETPEYIDSIKTYIKSIKEFLQKHKDVKLYINYDVCNGSRMYYKNGKFFDLFDDIKRELDGVLDRVVIATVKDRASKRIAPSVNYGLDAITDGIKRYDGSMEELTHVMMRNDEKFQQLLDFVAKITAKDLKLKIDDPIVRDVTNDIATFILLPTFVKLSRALNHREYYHFDKDNKMKIFDEKSEVGKKKKNEFLGLKKRNVQAKKNIKTFVELAQEIMNR